MPIPDDLFQRFEALSEACIDASSIIYMQKAGFFTHLCQALHVYTIPAIVEEIGHEVHGIHLLPPTHHTLSPDAQLIQCARDQQCALISEDKQILHRAKRANLPYYNALMMLNWLYFKSIIRQTQYQEHYVALQACARYSAMIWEYGNAVYQRITTRYSPQSSFRRASRPQDVR